MVERRQNPRTKKTNLPTLKERLEQEQAALAQQTAATQTTERGEVPHVSQIQQEGYTPQSDSPDTEELESIIPLQREESQMPSASDEMPEDSGPLSEAPEVQKSDVLTSVQEEGPLYQGKPSNTEDLPAMAASREAIPSPGFPYLIERKQLSARIDKRLIKAMQHFAIDHERNDYEVWEEAAKAFLLENDVKWSKTGGAH